MSDQRLAPSMRQQNMAAVLIIAALVGVALAATGWATKSVGPRCLIGGATLTPLGTYFGWLNIRYPSRSDSTVPSIFMVVAGLVGIIVGLVKLV